MLTLSVGFVVDDAIVMLENIVRQLSKKAGCARRAAKGARDFAVIVDHVLAHRRTGAARRYVGRVFRLVRVVDVTPMLCARVLHSRRRRQAEHRAARFRSHVQWLAARVW